METSAGGGILAHTTSMVDPEQINNIEPFPAVPRDQSLSSLDQEEDAVSETTSRPAIQHSLTPVKAMKVQYWHQGEHPSPDWNSEAQPKKSSHAKRADQLSLLLIVCALLLVGAVGLTLYFSGKRYFLTTDESKKEGTAMVDFYLGNHTFSQKVAEEKAAKLGEGHQIHGISTVNEDLEVPLSEQMNSMSEKMKQMRSVKQADEPLPPTHDTGPNIGLTPLKPTKDANFQSPLEFNNSLPKVLQKTP